MTRVVLTLGVFAAALTALVASPASAFQVSVASPIVSLSAGALKLELVVSPPQPELASLTIETIVDTEGKTVASDVQVTGNGASFVANAPATLGAGLYKMKVSTEASGENKEAVYEVLPFKVTVPAEIATLKVNGDALPKNKKIVNSLLTSAGNDGLRVDVELHNKLDKSSLTAHQAFLRFTHKEDKTNTYFVMNKDAKQQHSIELNFAQLSKKFAYTSGAYSVQIVLGDPKFDAAIVRELGDVELLLAAAPPLAPSPLYAKPLLHESDTTLQALPEIKHVMRAQDTRPPIVVSLAFTAAVLVPLVAFLLFVLKLQLNVSHLFRGSVFVFGVGFLASLAAILVLFGWYWIELSMFQTLGYLAVIGTINIWLGHLTLKRLAQGSSIASKTKKE